MNTEYKILWIDDSDDYYDSSYPIIEDIVRKNHMNPQIKYYQFFDEFQSSELEHFDIDTFNLYDQIIIDHALSGTTGDKIIRDLRSRNIFTDIVFYSSNYDRMVGEIKEGSQLDGVFFAHREDLSRVVDNVIKKNLKREYDIANIRGLIMDSTSEFDYICRTTSLAMFSELSPDKKDIIIAKAKEYVGNAQSKSCGNFSKLQSQSDNDKYLKSAIESVDYIMDNKDRYNLMALILREFEGDEIFNDGFADTYQQKIIKPRNDLAHNKLYRGDCQKKLHIARKRQALQCSKDCAKCDSKYSIEECEKLRQTIYNYYLLFTGASSRTEIRLKEKEKVTT